MSKPASDLRRSPRVIRRYGILIGVTVAAGLLAGAAAAAVSPVMVTSTALVVLPQAGQNAAVIARGDPGPFTATQEMAAGSNQVLSRALPDARPAMSLTALRRDIRIGSPAPQIISVTAKGLTAGDAEATANAVARSYVRYVGSASSPAGLVPAHLLASATNATGTAPFTRLGEGAMLGTVAGLLTAVIAAVVSRRLARDRLPDSRGPGT